MKISRKEATFFITEHIPRAKAPVVIELLVDYSKKSFDITPVGEDSFTFSANINSCLAFMKARAKAILTAIAFVEQEFAAEEPVINKVSKKPISEQNSNRSVASVDASSNDADNQTIEP